MRTSLRPAPALLILLACLAAPHALANCTSPAGKEADVLYNKDFHTYQFCNGTAWIAMGPGGCFAPQSGAYQPTIPSGSGYFVLTKSSFAGNAHTTLPEWDSVCLTELTTNTGWKGYSTANSNGQLVASKVYAFACEGYAGTQCNNLMPVTTYYFANAGDSSAGGASFTTDSSGDGPNDSADWAAANYFNGPYTYWTWHPQPNTAMAWSETNNKGYWGIDDSTNAEVGAAGYTNGNRWTSTTANFSNGSYPIICYVDP